MARRGSETRVRKHSVLVRLSDQELRQLDARAKATGMSRAACLRAGVENDAEPGEGLANEPARLTATDGAALAHCAGSLGRLNGALILAIKTLRQDQAAKQIISLIRGYHNDHALIQRRLLSILREIK